MDELPGHLNQRASDTIAHVAAPGGQEAPVSPRKREHESGMDHESHSLGIEKLQQSRPMESRPADNEDRANGILSRNMQRGGSATSDTMNTGERSNREEAVHRFGALVSDHELNRFPSQPTVNGDQKSGQPALPSDQALGMVFEHSLEGADSADHRTTPRTSLVDVFEGPDVASVFHQWSRNTSPVRNQDKEQERVVKLSPARMQELASSPQSIPYRAAPPESDRGRRAVSDGMHAAISPSQPDQSATLLPSEQKVTGDSVPKLRPNKDLAIDVSAATAAKQPVRSRPQGSRAVSTPNSRRQTMPTTSERLTQTWTSRGKQERASLSRESDGKHLTPSPHITGTEPALPSPMPPTIPLPPLSVPTYLQLELASGRPSPLYIHRSAMSDFPYESSRVKLERLMNFLMLPPALERVLWFGILACLDSWLHTFTILPLRFVKALYILL
ncbi:hypothetical protein ABHI18_010931, partial [Aspergillus niger]